MISCSLAWLVLAALARAQDAVEPAPLSISICLPAQVEAEGEQGFVQGARLAVSIRNRRGGVFGHPLAIVPLGDVGTRKAAREAVVALGAGEFVGVLAAGESEGLVAVRDVAARRGLAVLVPARAPADEAEVLAATLIGTYHFARVALLADGSPAAKALRRELEPRLAAPCALVAAPSPSLAPKALLQALEAAQAEVLVVDVAAEDAPGLAAALAPLHTPLVLSTRAAPARAAFGRELLFVEGRSTLVAPPKGEFLAEFRKANGEPSLGAAEGYELVELLATALERSGTIRADGARAGLATTHLDGPRGSLQGNATGVVSRPLALWRFADRSRPHLPPALVAGVTIPDGAGRTPDAHLGAAFGELRTLAFRPEPGARTVQVSFGTPESATIDADLARLGLTTGGASPFVDHLVREELLARTLSIVSTKYLRAADGRSVPGQSLRVAFVAHLPADAGDAWEAEIAGADPSANGRAFPAEGRCQVFSTNWLGTVLAHKLEPPLGAGDLGYLDGTYVFGSDFKKDRRSELVRALIEGYASSLGLTTAHEVGHLFGLEHDSGDPTSLMSVDEEHGLSPEDAHFSADALARLRRSPGVVK